MNPISIFEKYYRPNTSCLLESASFNNNTGRYSIMGTQPEFVFRSWGNLIQINDSQKFSGDPVRELNRIFKERREKYNPALPPFTGGAIGYIGYDAVRLWENIGEKALKDIHIPDIYLLFYNDVIVYDHCLNKIFEFGKSVTKMFEATPRTSLNEDGIADVINPAPSNGILDPARRINSPSHLRSKLWGFRRRGGIKPDIQREKFLEMVVKAKEYISAGDIYQANISQRFQTEIDLSGWQIYKRLRDINPAPFAGYMEFDGLEIISCSPERLVKVCGNQIETRPIAGTYPRGKTEAEDKNLADNLVLNPKERAEHIMLVDLERNDLGKVCEYGSVEVSENMTVESYSHVHHIVSNVSGKISEDIGQMDVLKAVFPGGTITGCPKIRCMQIIDELEPVRRNIYTGCMGWIGYNGNMDLNITIRTILKTGNKVYFNVGAGIVADSIPEREYNETLHKAGAMVEALKIECNCGFRLPAGKAGISNCEIENLR